MIRLLRRAQRNLARILPAERQRLIDDVLRLASRTLPGEIKPIASLPGKPLQIDAGRFQILHAWEGKTLRILAIFATPGRHEAFRGLRKHPRT